MTEEQAAIQKEAALIEEIETIVFKGLALLKEAAQLAKKSGLEDLYISIGELGQDTGRTWLSENGWESSYSYH